MWNRSSGCCRCLLQRLQDYKLAGYSQQCYLATDLPRITQPQKMVQKLERVRAKKSSRKHQQWRQYKGPVIISCRNQSRNHHKGQTYSNFNPNHLASGTWKNSKSKLDYFTINATQGNPALSSPDESTAQSFSEFGLNSRLLQSLDEMGIKKPTVIQALAIPPILKRKNVICAAETGSGKTLAYMLPLLEHLWRSRQTYQVPVEPNQPFGIVIVPSRELADQIYDVARHLGAHMQFDPHHVCGGRGTQKLLRNPEVSTVDLLVATPGVLSKLLTNRCYNMSRLNHVILDEADTLLDDSFSDLTLRLLQKMKIQSDRGFLEDTGIGTQVTLAGATMPRSLHETLPSIVPMETVEKVTTPHLHRLMPHVPQKFLHTSEPLKPETLLNILKGKGKKTLSTIVFCRNSKTVCFVGLFLKENGINSTVLHAQMPQKRREGLFQQFQNGECDVLVCTDIASRGLDTIRAERVLNYDFPSFMSDYIHRVGRVGRVGSNASSMAISLVAHKWEVDLLWKIETAARMTTELHNVNANIKRKLRSLAEERNLRNMIEEEKTVEHDNLENERTFRMTQ